MPGRSEETASPATLEVNLAALVENYRTLQKLAGPAVCAGVVKANGYGLGASAVSRALKQAGCNTFFVAYPEEGEKLANTLGDGNIFVLAGYWPACKLIYARTKLIPVLNSNEQIRAWVADPDLAARPCALHIDTGMARVGLSPVEFKTLCCDSDLSERLNPILIMSHLACADEPHHPVNREQLEIFRTCRELGQARFPKVLWSLANSSGIFLGPEYHFDLVRPGAALYGINPTPDAPNPMRPVATLKARILQVFDLPPGHTISYGATYRSKRALKIATAAIGYADGFNRILSNHVTGIIGGRLVQQVGRVTMDMTMFDATSVPQEHLVDGAEIDLIGETQDVNHLAKLQNTIGYEVLTSIGPRVKREYG